LLVSIVVVLIDCLLVVEEVHVFLFVLGGELLWDNYMISHENVIKSTLLLEFIARFNVIDKLRLHLLLLCLSGVLAGF